MICIIWYYYYTVVLKFCVTYMYPHLKCRKLHTVSEFLNSQKWRAFVQKLMDPFPLWLWSFLFNLNIFWICWRHLAIKVTFVMKQAAVTYGSWQCSFVLQAERWTPLHQAALVGDVEAVSKLIDSGADLNAKDIVSIVCYHTEIPLYKFVSVK